MSDREHLMQILTAAAPYALPSNADDLHLLLLADELLSRGVTVQKHGRWILAKPRVRGRNATYKCTACGKMRSSYYNDVQEWEYCPCGAKMDGEA